MKKLGRTSPFYRFTNPGRDKSVYFWSWGSYLLLNEESRRGLVNSERDNFFFIFGRGWLFTL